MYDGISQTDVKALKAHYKKLNENKIDFAFYAYSAYEQNSKDLLSLCANEFDMSRSNTYKYIHAGKVIHTSEVSLPYHFSGIALLYKVLENLTHFDKWLSEEGKTLKDMSTREIEKAVKIYYQTFLITEEEKEAQEEVESTVESFVDSAVDIKNKADKLTEKIDNLIEVLQPVTDPAIVKALEIINEMQILIGGK